MERKLNAFNNTPRGKHWLGLEDDLDSHLHYLNRRKNGSNSAISTDSYNIKNEYNSNNNNNNTSEGIGTDRLSYISNTFDDYSGSSPNNMTDFTFKDTFTENFFKGHKDINNNINIGSSENSQKINISSNQSINKSDKQKLPLISPTILEISKQRLLIVLFFILIQCYKTYDLICLRYNLPVLGIFGLLNYSQFNFITKYLILDSLFWLFLPILNIPRFKFNYFIICLQLLLINSINILIGLNYNTISITFIFTILHKFFFPTKKLTLMNEKINSNSNNYLDFSNHFKGAMTIKILPENSAWLNYDQLPFCLPMEQNDIYTNSWVDIPIRINSTDEIKLIELEYRDIYTNEINYQNFTKLNYESENLINLPLNKIGLYQISKIIDSNGLNLKIYQSHLIIPYCPIASIDRNDQLDKCIGDSDQKKIEVHGVPPLQIIYSKEINGNKQFFNDKNLQPKFFKSPLQSSKKNLFNANDLNDLNWIRSHTIEINLDSFTNMDGIFTYKIEKLVDSLGNIIDFTKIDNDIILKKYDLLSTFNVHNVPRASLDEKFNSNSPTKKDIIISLENIKNWENEIPFIANISIWNNENEKIDEKLIELNFLSNSIVANYPGTYQINSIDSKFCSGIITGKSNILITKPISPKLEVKSSSIIDKCVGPIGLDFDLTFTGVPPFHYTVKVYKIDKEKKTKKLFDTKRLHSNGARNHFSYLPAVEGNFEIVFDNLTNDIFTDPIHLTPVKDFVFKTSMRVKPSATLPQSKYFNLCLGDSTKIPIQLKGEPPFTLNYDILEISTNKRTLFKLENITEHSHFIESPSFDVGGDYIVSLVSIMDASNCLVGLSESDAKIKVRRDIPSASFNLLENLNESRIKQGSFSDIPLRLAGEPPFTVNYQHLDLDGKLLGNYNVKFLSNFKQSLRVNKEGIYKLDGMSDSSCKGKIDNVDTQYKVLFLEKPSFQIQENDVTRLTDHIFTKNAVCQNYETTVDLSLTGSPPFILKYDITTPSGEIINHEIQVTTKYASLILTNDEPGEYRIAIKEIFDSNYAENDYRHDLDSSNDEIIVTQIANPVPKVVFAEKGKLYKACSLETSKQKSILKPIQLKQLRGEGPFSITFSIYHESTSRTDYFTIDNVDLANFPYHKIYEGLKLGKHVVNIESITDVNGCINDSADFDDNSIFISITDVPKIHLLDPNAVYCVGDYVTYQLNGIPPFTINYEFNGVQLKSQERSSQFVRLASDPGIISIDSIQDSLSQCKVDFTEPSMEQEFNKLSLTIQPIPSVTVSQGNYVVEDIHEGDQAEVVFTFEGTPPFALTYVRTEDTDGNANDRSSQVVETHKVTDIYDYEYKVITSLQGTYEAIEISDAFCFAKNEAFFNN